MVDSRSAAMGAVDAAVVSSVFYNFNPRTVERFIPEAWAVASPEKIVQVRYAAADQSFSVQPDKPKSNL